MDNIAFLRCPNCSTEMYVKVEPDHKIHACKICKSIFTNKITIDIIAPGLIDDQELKHIVPLSEDDKPVRRCPSCSEFFMGKITVYENLDIVLDHCPYCNGIFFDKGEFTKLLYNSGEEYHRKTIDGHLVKVSIINTVHRDHLDGYDGKVYYINVSVFYAKPLGLGLSICSEKTKHKLLKLLGIFKQQDIEISDQHLNRCLIIQGDSEAEIVNLLSKDAIISRLTSITNKQKSLYSRKGIFLMNDTHISYTEGPYRKYLTERPYFFEDKKSAKNIALDKFPLISEFLDLAKEMNINEGRTKRLRQAR